MTLSAGTRLGPYEILTPLGSGGMGEVYRARDTRLAREVAIKVLPEEVGSDPERLRRFEKEARAASALNHPNIVTIYDIGREGDVSYIAMELVEGVTLRDLLAAGPLPTRRLLTIAAQVAEGLSRAHEAGIVHRDLKPENLMVTRDNFLKILDFGLAKLVAPEPNRATQAPTVSAGTEPGVVMGTAAYMSPEQAMGRTLDFRSDQFSLGSILYEVATGGQAFSGKTKPETLAAIIREEPEPIASLNPRIPAPVRWIIERCLAKDPEERYTSTRDLARDLSSLKEHVSELSGGETALSAFGRRPRERVAWWVAAAALLVGLAAGFLARGRRAAIPGAQPVMRLNLAFPRAESPVFQPYPGLALSPDGTLLAYVGRKLGGGNQLYIRPLDRFQATPIPGTEGAGDPFFSPNGEWLGFWADGKLKKVSLAGGQPLTLCAAPVLRGASWGPDGTILFSPSGQSGLWRVSDNGGEPKAATKLSPEKGEETHRWPEILPGGKAAIFTINRLTGDYDKARIATLRLDTGERKTLFEGGTDARYVPTGYLVYLRRNSLYAVPFDAEKLAVTGEPFPVLDELSTFGPAGFANYAFSEAGTLAYFPYDPSQNEGELVWVDRKGAVHPLTDTRRIYQDVRVSPDGRRLAVTVGEPGSDKSDIWIYDTTRNGWEKIISGGDNAFAVWSPDGRRLAFASNRNGPINTFSVPVDRSSPAEQLTKTDTWPSPTSWSRDGRLLLITDQPPATGLDIAVLPFDGDRRMRSFLRTPAAENNAQFSPDGRWIAYQSDESGRLEVYVMAYPGPGGRWQVSTNGGLDPLWSPDGREIYFQSGGKMMAAAVETRQEFRAGQPQPLFDLGNMSSFDIAPDGKRFVAVRTVATDSAEPLSIVLRWFEDIKRRAAGGKKVL